VTSTEPPSGILGPQGWILELAALCPECIPAAIIGAVALFLIAPNQLANSDLTVPYTVSTSIDPGASFTNQAVLAKYGLHLIPHDVTTSTGSTTSTTSTSTSGGGQPPPGGRPVAAAGGFCSFTPDTSVSTNQGEQPIGKLHPGDKVWAYNPKTHKMELQPILHVWTHQDHDLVDLTLTTTTKGQKGTHTTPKSEVLHTTSEHPFLTTEQGFVPAGKLHTGMHVLRADGSVGVVTGWKLVAGTKIMYNLEVQQDHTFVVGDGQWVVHNKCDRGQLRNNLSRTGTLLDNQQAHHIIPCALEGEPLVQKAGFDINSANNGIGLPNSAELSLSDNLPQHFGDHPDYTRAVARMLANATDALGETYGNFANVPSNVAMQTLMDIISTLRDTITNAGGGCSINDVLA
jgi:hypothetical protein